MNGSSAYVDVKSDIKIEGKGFEFPNIEINEGTFHISGNLALKYNSKMIISSKNAVLDVDGMIDVDTCHIIDGTIYAAGDIKALECGGANTVILDGTVSQSINGSFSNLKVMNSQREVLTESISIGCLLSDLNLVINNDNAVDIYNLNGNNLNIKGNSIIKSVKLGGGSLNVDGNVQVKGNIDLEGGEMNISQNMDLIGLIYINKGRLSVEGNMQILTHDDYDTKQCMIGMFLMQYPSDCIEVYGDFSIDEIIVPVSYDFSREVIFNDIKYVSTPLLDNEQAAIIAGTLKLHGNVNIYKFRDEVEGLMFTGTHKTVFCGDNTQKIGIENPVLNYTEFKNTHIVGVRELHLGKLVSDAVIEDCEGGRIHSKSFGLGSCDLNGHNLTVISDNNSDKYIYITVRDNIDINKGALNIEGTLYIDGDLGKIDNYIGKIYLHGGKLNVYGDCWLNYPGILKMDSSDDFVNINGNFIAGWWDDNPFDINAGIIKVTKCIDLRVRNDVILNADYVILDGYKDSDEFYYSIGSYGPKIDTLKLTRSFDEYSFPFECWNHLILADEDIEFYTVTFDLQGHGTALDEYSKYTEIKKGSKINRPTSPEAEGYKFTGWYKDSQCSDLWNFELDIITSNMTLYAGWEQENSSDNPSDDIPVDDIPSGIWVANIGDYTYTGKAIIPSVNVYYNKKKLVSGKDYTITYKNNTRAATSSASKAPTVIVKGKGNYSGTKKAAFTIHKANLTVNNLRAAKIYPAGVKYSPIVVSGDYILKAGTDYTLVYKDDNGQILKKQPTKAGSYQMCITGKGNCEGEISFQYTVSANGGANMISKGTVTISNIIYGSGKEPDLTLSVNGKILKRGTDYLVTFANTGKKGTATATFIGIGDYTGTLKKKFKVQAATIQEKDINILPTVLYEKGGVKVNVSVVVGGVELVAGTDYTVAYKNNTKVGTAKVTIKGKGNYSGSQTKNFKIESKALTEKGVKIFVSDALVNKKPTVAVFDTNGKKLSSPSDYKVEINKTTHQATITGGKNGLYKVQNPIIITYQELTKGKQITSAALNKKANDLPKYFEYTGREVVLKKDWLTVKAGKVLLKSDEFEIIGYVNNIEKGTATVIIRGCKNYGGIKMLNFKIKAKGLL